MNEIEIIENWVKLGLTEGSKNVRNISLAFETAAKNIINNSEIKIEVALNELKSYETIIFPVIRRIFDKNTDALDMEISKIEEETKKIEIEFKNWLDTVDFEVEKLKAPLIDVEAHLVANFCDEYNKFGK